MACQKDIGALNISLEQMNEVVKQGVDRALAARSAAMELTPEQVSEVSGGALALKLIPTYAGGLIGPVRPDLNTNPLLIKGSI